MNTICWLSRLSNQKLTRRVGGRIAWSIGLAALLMTTSVALAQDPVPQAQPVTAPKGYSIHEAIDLGGRISDQNGSGAMYDTLVNEQSGPRVQGEMFQMKALPGAKNTLLDSLTAVGSGFGGDPYSFAKVDFYKGNIYEFSGLFRRDRQYFDYDLLGNPNIPSGQSVPLSGGGSFGWPQVNQSPFLFNTVRRMTDTHLTLFPLSKITFRAGYSHDTFEGPSLTPSGYQFAGSYDVLLQELQRNGTDDFVGGIDWKVAKDTKLTYEEVVDHYKADSYFTMNPGNYIFQEPDGTRVAPLANYDSLTPYSTKSACNANSVGATAPLSAPNMPGGLPVINPACAVVLSYLRTQPTRFLYPTEIFRFQSSSIRNFSMNGDLRYTSAKMNLPLYYENFQGLTPASKTAAPVRSMTYNATGNAQRKVTAADYGIVWQVIPTFSVSDQATFSNVQQPGTTTMTSLITLSTPATAGNETIDAGGLTTAYAKAKSSTFEGSSTIGVPLPDFFGQRWITNDVTGTWDGWSRATISLTYRHQKHLIAEGIPHNTALAVTNVPSFTNPTSNGTVTINENGGILNIALRPSSKWDVNGSAEIAYSDNAFTPVAPRQLQHYRMHTLYRARPWATLSGAYNDLERHNNGNNTGTAPLDGPLQHVDHTRVASLGAEIYPNEHYGLDLNYAYSDVYTATNICYLAAASATDPGAATPSGSACPGSLTRSGAYDFGPVKDFMDAPTQSGSVAFHVAPNAKVASNVGYRINSVDGSRFYNDPRDVAGSLVSSYQTPFVNLAWTVHPGFVWKAEYALYRYAEGAPSGAPYCSTTNPTPTVPAPGVACASMSQQTGMNLTNAGETAPREFHASNVTLGFHYEF
ncbi:MAG TPA: hypothetical protein VHU89_04810 [Acidobacteriaceae bacterium]|jgi:hypothetical protein|nr:hypothetical protein [Acidobacteriaceae bacterium]